MMLLFTSCKIYKKHFLKIMKALHLDSSARKMESVSRKLASSLVNKITKENNKIIYRIISKNVLFIAGIKGSGLVIPEEERIEEDKNLFT